MTRIPAAVLTLALVASAPHARADVVDPATPKIIAVGSPRGPAPSERVDVARTGRARGSLPDAPTELWSHHVSGGVEVAPIVDANDDILVAPAVPDLVKLSAAGKELWRARLGGHAAALPPVLTSAGNVVVVTTGGSAVLVSPGGAVLRTVTLGAKPREVDAAPSALRDGGVVVAANRTLIALDAGGSIAARALLDERTTGAFVVAPARPGSGELADTIVVTGESGAVYTWRPPSVPRKVASLAGLPKRGVVLANARTLLAVVDGRRLVSVDLVSGLVQGRATVSFGGAPLDGPPIVGPGGLVYVATQSGLALGIDAAGNERVRALLEKTLPPAPLGPTMGPMGSMLLGAIDYKPSPPIVVDPAGRIAFARSGRVGIVRADGRVVLATERGCSVPVAVVPAGPHRFAVVCRDGNLAVYGP